MEKHQKKVLWNFATVFITTIIAVFGMFELKNRINRSEAMLAMENMGRIVLKYREDRGLVPPETYISSIKEQLPGSARLGELHYRSRWITPESTPDEVLAYTQKKYNSLFYKTGYIILRLDGTVEWMDMAVFEPLLESQQSPIEKDLALSGVMK